MFNGWSKFVSDRSISLRSWNVNLLSIYHVEQDSRFSRMCCRGKVIRSEAILL